MKTYGQTGTYVSATGPIDLPRPKRGRRGHVATQPRCTTCRLPLSRPDSPHVCLDLSKPEVVVAVKVVKGKPRAQMTPAELEKARAKDRRQRDTAAKTCEDCGIEVTRLALRCIPCQNKARRKVTPEIAAQIVELYEQRYWSVVKIAAHVSLGQITVTGVLDRHGIKRPGKGNHRRAS